MRDAPLLPVDQCAGLYSAFPPCSAPGHIRGAGTTCDSSSAWRPDTRERTTVLPGSRVEWAAGACVEHRSLQGNERHTAFTDPEDSPSAGKFHRVSSAFKLSARPSRSRPRGVCVLTATRTLYPGWLSRKRWAHLKADHCVAHALPTWFVSGGGSLLSGGRDGMSNLC